MTSATSLARSGLADFLLQRVTAVVLALYAGCIVGWFIVNEPITHAQLVAYLGSTAMRLFTTLALLAVVAHGWIGMWTIGTDYLRPHYFGRHAAVFRLLYHWGMVLVLFAYFGWGLVIVWAY